MREKKSIAIGLILALASTISLADKEVYYQDKNIIIYTDNTVVRVGETKPMMFSASKTWVEEDFFTQQAKYCEVDGKLPSLSKLKKPMITPKTN